MGKSGSRLFSLIEGYKIMYRAFKSMRFLSKSKNKGLVSKQFSERIMLAVTEVNGCAICSYAHTQMALENGLTGDEIKQLLGGAMDDVPSKELPAIMFAQHFAEMRGYPSDKAKKELIDDYGMETAERIVANINMIMLGNCYGIPAGSFVSRFKKNFKGEVDSRSNPLYEIIMLLSVVVFLPISLVHAFIARLFRAPILKTK
jgi:AhpD family alkylhydroperoxidase